MKNNRIVEKIRNNNIETEQGSSIAESVEEYSTENYLKHKQTGITLIALVITIIILLILASITINLTLGERGIFNTAQKAGQNYKEAQDKELAELTNFEKETENTIKGIVNISEDKIIKSKIIYNSNGGNGQPDSQTAREGETVTLNFNEIPTKKGYTFLGWGTSADIETPEYTKDGITNYTVGKQDITLYAIWKKNIYLDISNPIAYNHGGFTITSAGEYSVTAIPGYEKLNIPIMNCIIGKEYNLVFIFGVPAGVFYGTDRSYMYGVSDKLVSTNGNLQFTDNLKRDSNMNQYEISFTATSETMYLNFEISGLYDNRTYSLHIEEVNIY